MRDRMWDWKARAEGAEVVGAAWATCHTVSTLQRWYREGHTKVEPRSVMGEEETMGLGRGVGGRESHDESVFGGGRFAAGSRGGLDGRFDMVSSWRGGRGGKA